MKKKEPPINEFLICSYEASPHEVIPQEGNPFFMGFYTEMEGEMVWMVDDGCGFCEECDPPQFWRRIPK